MSSPHSPPLGWRAPLAPFAAVVLALGMVACGGSPSASPTRTGAPASAPTVDNATSTAAADTPTAGSTGTPSGLAERPGDDGFRAFARKLDSAIRRDDIAFIRVRMRTTPVDCTGPDVNTPGGPVCDYPGQRYDGIAVGHWRSEGGVAPANGVADQFAGLFENALPPEKDQFGDGTPQVYALNVAPGEYPGGYAAVVTAIIERPPDFAGTGPLRVSIGTYWDYADGAWQMTGVLYAYVLGEELLQPKSTVTESPYPQWERFGGR